MTKIHFNSLLGFLFAALLSGCGLVNYAAIPGESQAGLVLKQDVANLLLPIASINLAFAVNNPNCVEKVSIKNIVRTKIINRSVAQSAWKEIWYIKICNKVIPYEVSFQPDGSGGTYFNITEAKSKS